MPYLIIPVCLLLIAYLTVGFACVQKSMRIRHIIDYTLPKTAEKTGIIGIADKVSDARDFVTAHTTDTPTILSSDNKRLTATYLANQKCRGIVIFSHGYASTATNDFAPLLTFLFDSGFDLLLINQRAHGKSEGKYLTFGVKESDDLRLWAEYAAKAKPGVPILLYGLSMGATSVMYACGENLPSEVKCAVADCGFNSPAGILSYQMRRFYRLPLFLLPSVALWARLLAGYDIYCRTTADAMKECHIPMLFLHGGADDYVPAIMTASAYTACNAPKELVTVENAAHGMSVYVDTAMVTETLDKFLQKYFFEV